MQIPWKIHRYFLPLLTACIWGYTGYGQSREKTHTSEYVYSVSLPSEVRTASPFSSENFSVPKKPKIGLVLSGGGARGLAQLGVLRALDEAGIIPDFIVGTSIGSIIGGLYAAGYSVGRLENTIKQIDWNDLLRLSNQSGRENLLVDQKPVQDRSIFSVRFDGLRPVLPTSVSNGQRLTNLMNELTLQGLYHTTNFDELRIPFRAVATDIYSGKRIVLGSGSLGEAIRASSTVPVLYAPIDRDSVALVDGGLRSNIPVDIAKSCGCDIIIAVNTTSPPRDREQMKNPIETLDQVFNVMMEQTNEEQLLHADCIITPDIGKYLSTDFPAHDTLIALGYSKGKEYLPRIRSLLEQATLRLAHVAEIGSGTFLVSIDAELSDSDHRWLSTPHTLEESLVKAYELSNSNAYSDVKLSVSSSASPAIHIETSPRQRIQRIAIIGAEQFEQAFLNGKVQRWTGAPYCPSSIRSICESVLEEYRHYGYSFAKIDSVTFDANSSFLSLFMNEGKIGEIIVEGNTRTNPVVILREFPLREGEIFRISDARRGMNNITSLNLFHHVSFEISEERSDPRIVIRVEERSSQVLQIGILINNERNAQIGVELRDANIFGTGTEASALFFGGYQNRKYAFTYNTNRMFYTNLSFNTQAYYELRDYYGYGYKPGLPASRFEREVEQVFRRISYGASGTAGLYVERFGNLTGTLRIEHQQLRTMEIRSVRAREATENHRIVSLAIGTTIDTQDRYPYPRKGIYLTGQYISAQAALGSEISFSKIYANYDFYISSPDNLWTFHPRACFGYGDKTLPLAEEFRLGGLYSFYGMRENEFTGQQLFVGSLEVRYQLPIQILFDSFLSLRYDLGRAWDVPEQIKFADLRHGAGISIGLDTPIGPADFAIGKSFIFSGGGSGNLMQPGPTYLYFSIGIGLQ